MEEPSMNSKSRSFTSSEIAKMTSNFTTVIGNGGFGVVYSGTMNDGTAVAVKVLRPSSETNRETNRKTFLAEVKLLTIIDHKNLVSLVGYCDEDGKEALIYDYMPNGNLKQNLLEKSETILSWSGRLRIAQHVAYGLEYLHGCKPPIIHRDLKPENILFDKIMQAKIADFGLSVAFPTESASHLSTCPAGTFGYLDPETFRAGHVSKKSDLYSFGIILLVLISGKPAVIRDKEGSINISNWIDPLFKRGDIRSIVDPRLNGEFHIKAAQRVIKIAMSCVKPITKRPDISHVLAELKQCRDIEMCSTLVQETGWFNFLDRIFKTLTKGQLPNKSPSQKVKLVTILVLNVNLQCSKCYEKVKKLLSKFPEVRDQVYDLKANKIIIKVVSCSPGKVRDELCSKGGGSIKSIALIKPGNLPRLLEIGECSKQAKFEEVVVEDITDEVCFDNKDGNLLRLLEIGECSKQAKSEEVIVEDITDEVCSDDKDGNLPRLLEIGECSKQAKFEEMVVEDITDEVCSDDKEGSFDLNNLFGPANMTDPKKRWRRMLTERTFLEKHPNFHLVHHAKGPMGSHESIPLEMVKEESLCGSWGNLTINALDEEELEFDRGIS